MYERACKFLGALKKFWKKEHAPEHALCMSGLITLFIILNTRSSKRQFEMVIKN